MRPNATLLSAYSGLFSAAVLREMASKGRSGIFARLVRECKLLDTKKQIESVSDAFEAVFSFLKVPECRDEYIYRTAITHKVLLGTHSLKSASMLSEFRVADCKADVVILNGTATVYEIKSERDSLSRLSKQIETYRKVFARAYVITGENHVHSVLSSVPRDVGVMLLSKRQQIKTIREAEDRPDRLCPLTVFDSLRIIEAREILTQFGIKIPEVPNTMIHSELRKLFIQLSPCNVHTGMVKTLKKTRDLAPLEQFVSQLPFSLKAAALSMSLKKSDHARFISAIDTKLIDALNWT